MKRARSYKESLIESLKNPKEAIGYLNAALADIDQRVFLLALRDVVEAQLGGMTEASRKAELNRENLYRMLSENGNPEFSSLEAILHAMGLELAVREAPVCDDRMIL